MAYAITAVVVIILIWVTAKAASGDRYSKMTGEEFEAEAKRSSSLGAAVAAFQKVIDPSHHVEYVQEQQQRIEAESSKSGDGPEPGSPPSSPS